MKKLVMALAVATIVGMAQAASFKWTTGALYAPNADGTVGTTVASEATGTWLATVTLYSDSGCTTPIAAVTGNSSSTVNAMSNAIGDTFGGATFSYDGTTLYYAVLELSYTTAAGTQTLTTDVVSTTLKKTGSTTLSFSSPIASASWSAVAVPEPTSGLLMLLGMAGLALKRKRA
jgi:hypothetical protein